jgi:hypothetical protein
MFALIAHHLITLCFAWAMIGALIWMVLFTSGRLAPMYGEPSGSGALIDGLANVLITIVLIIGWPGTLSAFAVQLRRVRR